MVRDSACYPLTPKVRHPGAKFTIRMIMRVCNKKEIYTLVLIAALASLSICDCWRNITTASYAFAISIVAVYQIRGFNGSSLAEL